jgi:hypothetical protein
MSTINAAKTSSQTLSTSGSSCLASLPLTPEPARLLMATSSPAPAPATRKAPAKKLNRRSQDGERLTLAGLLDSEFESVSARNDIMS